MENQSKKLSKQKQKKLLADFDRRLRLRIYQLRRSGLYRKKIEKEMSGLIGKTTEETIKNAKDYIQNKAVENSIREIKEENLGKREQQ